MSNAVSFSLNDITGEVLIAFKSLSVPVAKAATIAIHDAGDLLKTEARALIRASGFSMKWEKAYRVHVYPGRGFSVDAAAQGLFAAGLHYSDIFATGGTIQGKPFLWLPLKTTPKLDRRKSAADIADYRRKGVKLFSFRSRHGKPLVGAHLQMTKGQANRGDGRIKLTSADVLSGSKRGAKGKRNLPGMVSKSVPLFFGIPSMTIRKRLEWQGLESKVQAQLPALYDAAIQQLADK